AAPPPSGFAGRPPSPSRARGGMGARSGARRLVAAVGDNLDARVAAEDRPGLRLPIADGAAGAVEAHADAGGDGAERLADILARRQPLAQLDTPAGGGEI